MAEAETGREERVGSTWGPVRPCVDSSLHSESIGQSSRYFEWEGVALISKNHSAILISRSDKDQNEGKGCAILGGLDKAAAGGDVGK